jgi:manganese-dependent inorganic pyrophosphatase
MTVLVIGHRNPDMDAVASAIGFAWLLNQLKPGSCTAACAGQINAQTKFALEKFGLPVPPIVSDIRPRVSDVTEGTTPLRREHSLAQAVALTSAAHRPLPLVDDDKPIGMVTPSSLFPVLASAAGGDQTILNQPARTALDPLNLLLRADDYTREVIPMVLRSEQDDFAVIDSDGHYVGMCRKNALLAPPRRQIILVDHNEPGQAVFGLDEAEIVQILDHHRLGSLPTETPIRIQIEPVGSCATLVAERIRALEVACPPEIAGVLLSGILSDTLVFRSPTTTPRDQNAGVWLGVVSGVGDDAAVVTYGEELLRAGAGLSARPAAEIVRSDLKEYESGVLRFGIAQVEVTSFAELNSQARALAEALETLRVERGYALAVLTISDVLTGNSRLIAVGQPRLLAVLPYSRPSDAPEIAPAALLDAPGIVSRKKQILPALLAALAAYG